MGADEIDNAAKFTISGKVSLYVVGILIAALISFGTLTANYLALEKRINDLELKEEKTCVVINDLLIVNARIGENLSYIKDTLKEHVKGDK